MQELKLNNYKVGSKLTLKKKHPCGSFDFEVIRTGADIKIKCQGCGRVVMLDRLDLNKRIKKITNEEEA